MLNQTRKAWLVTFLLLLGGTGTSAQPANKDAPQPLPAEIAKAWKEAGAETGWVKDTPAQLGTYKFFQPWREKGGMGDLPAFRFPEKK